MGELSFATDKRLRLTSLGLLYAAQGVPEGLLYVAVPAWLADRGVSPEAISAYIAIILLPWSLKLINGLIMDRLAYLPMGRRRPWLLGAQFVLVLSLLALGLSAPVQHDLVYLTVVGFLVNMSAAFQDVAIDGMAIDIVPERERAQANGFMWGGKTLGIAGSSLANGFLISVVGYGAAALATAAFVALIMLIPLAVRERPGEKLLPWTPGNASPESEARQLRNSWAIARRLFAVVIRPSSLLFGAAVFVALVGYGLHTAFEPIAAVQGLKFSQLDFGNLAATANLVGGLFGIAISGAIAAKLGHRTTLVAALAMMATLQLAVAHLPGALQSPEVFVGYTIGHSLLFVLTSVCIYAGAMTISTPAVSATQFSIYMALLNLGTSFGAQQFGPVNTDFGYAGVLSLAALVSILSAAMFVGSATLARRDQLR